MLTKMLSVVATLAEYAGTWRSKEYTGFTMQGLRDGGTVEKANPTMKGELQKLVQL